MKITGTCSRYRHERMLVGELLVNGVKVEPGGKSSTAWNAITGKPETFPPTVGATAETAAAGNHTHSPATPKADGFMPSGDKQKLDGIAEGATKYADANAIAAFKAKAEIAALAAPSADFADLKAATAAVKAIIDALKA